MDISDDRQQFDTVVIGGGQAGLAMGYSLAKQGRDFVILEASQRLGTGWRRRWDSLRLFTPAWISSLPGMPLPAADDTFVSKDVVADYLEAYAGRFDLPVRLNTQVDGLSRERDHYILNTGKRQITARQVVVTTGSYQRPSIPAFADELDPRITQLHSDAYRNRGQLQDGGVLVVGAGSSGAEIALELASTHEVWLAGRDPGHRPKNIPPLFKHLYWWLIHQAINTDNRPGRRLREQMERGGAPLIGISKQAFARAGVERVPRVVGANGEKLQLADGRELSASNVIWCTGYVPEYRWISLPIFDGKGYPRHTRGVVESEPGLYFLGLPFQYTLSSSFIGGVGRDAAYIAERIEKRAPLHAVNSPTTLLSV